MGWFGAGLRGFRPGLHSFCAGLRGFRVVFVVSVLAYVVCALGLRLAGLGFVVSVLVSVVSGGFGAGASCFPCWLAWFLLWASHLRV